MKSKDYAKQYLKDEETMTEIDCSLKVFLSFIDEIIEIKEARNVSTEMELIALVKEQENKWKEFCQLVNKDKPRFKEDGFLTLLVKELPWLEPMLKAGER